jgi:hypothetical protein
MIPVLALLGLGFAARTQAAVAVICNRSTADVRFLVAPINGDKQFGKAKAYSLPSNDLVVIEIPRGQQMRLEGDAGKYDIEPDASYYFGNWSSGKLGFSRISLSTAPPAAEPVIAASAAIDPATPSTAAERSPNISVKIFVDEEEAARPAIWSRRLRGRIAAASEILQKHCGIGLEVVDVGTWKSDNEIHDFDLAVGDFIAKADPGRARLAIGFSSQYQTPHGRTHLGGTRGPLQRHILLREWSQHVSEPEKLELLVHELGHHLGAAHSPETDAVMRPLLADRQSRAKKFIIRFDPLNTLAMNLVAEEVRERGIRQFSELTLPTKQKLRAIYTDIDKALPDDPAARIYLLRLGLTPKP